VLMAEKVVVAVVANIVPVSEVDRSLPTTPKEPETFPFFILNEERFQLSDAVNVWHDRPVVERFKKLEPSAPIC